MYRNYQRLSGYSVSGLVLPEFYNLSNSKSPAKAENAISEKAINSVLASANIGYKSLAFLDLTALEPVNDTKETGKNGKDRDYTHNLEERRR